MSFVLPDLVVESVLREGFIGLKRNPAILDDVFSSLTRSYANKKYGDRELRRIKDYIAKYDFSFVHSFGEVEANLPCVSIQLGNETEDRNLAHLEDFEEDQDFDIIDPDQLADLVKVTNILPTQYDDDTGTVHVPDGVDLSQVHINLLYVDAAGTEFQILGGIDDTPGSKQFMVAPLAGVDISEEGLIKSGIDYEQVTIRGVHSDVNLMLGVHTKEALLTKYFYILVKYFLLSRKRSLIERHFICSSYQGSDFTRNLKYQGDMVFTRFLTLTGKVHDSFKSDQTDIFDIVDVGIKVPKDVKTTEDLGLEDSTIQVSDTPQE